jgi:UDP:flavonoid glycosyltransferase YjiC (YdhE family)
VTPSDRNNNQGKKRIVVTTFGSLGDLHPYIAIALGLQARGHEVILAAGECYRKKIEALGVSFRPLRPDNDWVDDPSLMGRRMDPLLGTARVMKELLMPAVRDSYADTLAAAEGADLLVGNQATYATRLVAEKRGIPWVSVMHIPMGFFSAYDPPLLAGVTDLMKLLRCLGPAFINLVGDVLKRLTATWARPLIRLRAEIGLPPGPEVNPLVDGHAPWLHLALFSRRLVDKQRDWPPQTFVTGFPWFDHHGDAGLPPALVQFLEAGPPPLVFTLGTAVSSNPGKFYEVSAAAARRLGCRAVLILKDSRNQLASLPDGVAAFDYAPFSQLFPRAAAIIHHGGIGTTGFAMRSGRPMLVMPCAWDQPDNGARVARLGIARVLPPRHYNPDRVAAELRHLLNNPSYAQRAREVGAEVQREDGARTACDALEALLLAPGRPV